MEAGAWAELLAALLLILLLAEIVAVGLVRRLYSRFDDVDQALRRTGARGREQALRLELLDRLRNGQHLTEQMIGTGTTQTREVHQGIANIPFSILGNIPSTAPAARIARKLHDGISNDIYAAIAALNRGCRSAVARRRR